MPYSDPVRRRAAEARYRTSAKGRLARRVYEKNRRIQNPYYRELARQRVQAWAKRNPDYQNQWKISNWEKRLFYNAKGGALRKGCEFNITFADIVIPKRCPVLGILLKIAPGNRNPDTPSLDRIDNKKGYIPGNVRVISWRANRLKGDASADELIALGRDAEGIKNGE